MAESFKIWGSQSYVSLGGQNKLCVFDAKDQHGNNQWWRQDNSKDIHTQEKKTLNLIEQQKHLKVCLSKSSILFDWILTWIFPYKKKEKTVCSLPFFGNDQRGEKKTSEENQ